ncbi:LysR family transcriptional regulator substrate-binding protein [Pseudonocardia sp.]|uniref:LysR family transcriptional regulator substrate-binding protein n=1 Tax=Pseudonocardia sp. TaxID=60912 RepID=UPI0031FDA256
MGPDQADRAGLLKTVRITLSSTSVGGLSSLWAWSAADVGGVAGPVAGDGRVDIGTFQSVSNVILPLVVRRLRDEHPGCDIRLFEEETDQPQVHELDLTFFDGRIDGDVEHLKLLDDPYLLVARRDTFPDGPVRPAQLDGAPMVAHPPICGQARMEQALARRGVRPQIVCRTAGNETVLSMVRAGMGSAVLPQLAVHIADVGSDASLCVHELKPGLPPREIFPLWQANRTHSPLAARAIEIAVEVAGQIAKRT